MICNVRLLTVRSPAEAERELAGIDIDPFNIRNIAPKMVHRLLLLEGLNPREGGLLKQEMLSLGGDAALSVNASEVESQGVAILMGTEKQLRRLCSRLAEDPFGLPLLAGEIRHLLDMDTNPPDRWKFGKRELDLSRRPCIMGILNVTPDSFSDGNRFFSTEKAVERAFEMEEEGADIIDIGGESTRPFAPPVDADEEIRRVIPVIEKIAGRLKIPVSIDTYKASVAERAIAAGAEIINDISAFMFDERMVEVVATAAAGLVLMHTRSRPSVMQKDTDYISIVSEIFRALHRSVSLAEAHAIDRGRIVIDPGIGFGKNVEGNLEILRRLAEFRSIGCPIMVGTSRKSFIGQILGRETGERLFGTAATMAIALANGASVFRVHEVKEMRDVLDMTMALCRPVKS
ncbi:MAG TPA: dihydropteroate synthase [Geobacteraceae bacterium]|nr:dihydropteroate synthase [Geobacteraceae bacterium]